MLTRLELLKIRNALADFSGDDTLAGYCAIASYIISKGLSERGKRSTFHMNDFHCFVETQGYYIDITAKQFNNVRYPLVYMRKTRILEDNGWGTPIHKIDKKAVIYPYSNVEENTRFKRMFRGWPECQNPYKNFEIVKEAVSVL